MDGERVRAAVVLGIVVAVLGGLGWVGVTRLGWLPTLLGVCLVPALLSFLYGNIGSAVFFVALALIVASVSGGLAGGSVIVAAGGTLVGIVGAAIGWKWSGEHATRRLDPYAGIDFPKPNDD